MPFEEILEQNNVICPHCNEKFHRWGHVKAFSVESLRHDLNVHFNVNAVCVKTFVDFKRRSLLGKLKSFVRLVFGWFRQPLASSNIYFDVSNNK
ncbi:MAG: hypothetical protein R2827_11095 [Bdellovibrionales bacterium]